ncbi:MAG: putative epoxide hydrolase-related protein [Myxococcaceae bacterium]|nr:putative epoxide hydrolase-related protein [Myxococcaceae bacterium]
MPQAQLHYEMIQTRGLKFEVATLGEGDKLALLLHGFPECAHSWREQMPLLAKLGYRVWAPNLRGYGNTDRPEGIKAYSLQMLDGDVSDLIDASGASSVLLIGHDWGGAIAWDYAMHGTRPIDRLVVLNCPHPACFKKGLKTPAQLKRSWYMFLFQLPYVPELLLGYDHAASLDRAIRMSAVHRERFPKEVIEVYRDNASKQGALTAMLNYYRALFRSMINGTGRRGANIKVPTLLIWGEQDVALGKELTFGTERYVDNLTLRYIPDASHWVQQDAPEAVNTLLREWLVEPKPEQLSVKDIAG